MLRVSFVILSAALFLPAALPAQADKQPDAKTLLKDKPLGKWIDDLKSADPKVCDHAIVVLGQLGPMAKEAAPALLDLLKTSKNKEKQQPRIAAIATTLAAIGADARPAVSALASTLIPNGWGWDHNAFLILQLGGSAAEEKLAVRSLLLGRQRCTSSVLLAHGQVMKDYATKIMPNLAALLTDPLPRCRQLAAEGLGTYGEAAEKWTPALVQALNDKDVSVCAQVALTLVAVDPKEKQQVIDVLISLLARPEAAQSVMPALYRMGAAAIPSLLPLLREMRGEAQMPYITVLASMGELAVPALKKELSGPSVTGRVGAARALGEMRTRGQAAFDDLVLTLGDRDAELRFHAARALVYIDAKRARAAVPNLIAGLKEGKKPMAAEAIAALSLLGKSASDALPALTKALQDPELRLQAALAMVAIDAGQAEAAVPVLVETMTSAGNRLPIRQMNALGKIGLRAAAAAPALRKMLTADDVDLRVRAAANLARVAPEHTAEAVKGLMIVIRDLPEKGEAIAVLGEMGPAAREAVPLLKTFVARAEAGDSEWEMDAFTALFKIDPSQAAGVMPRIKESLQSNNQQVFRRGVDLLCAAAPGAPGESVPLLARALKDVRVRYKWNEIVVILGQIGPAAGEAVPVLQERLKDASGHQAEEIKEALVRINKPGKGDARPK